MLGSAQVGLGGEEGRPFLPTFGDASAHHDEVRVQPTFVQVQGFLEPFSPCRQREPFLSTGPPASVRFDHTPTARLGQQTQLKVGHQHSIPMKGGADAGANRDGHDCPRRTEGRIAPMFSHRRSVGVVEQHEAGTV